MMDNYNTDTQSPDRDFIRDSTDYWSSIDYKRLLRGDINPAKTDEELHDALGLGDRGIYHILTAIKRNNKP